MSKFRKIQNSFNAGELSEKFHGRTDFPQYDQGAETLENFLPRPEGGISKRPGFRFNQDTYSATFTNGTIVRRMFPFIFSKKNSYIVGFCEDVSNGDKSIRIWDSDGTEQTVEDDFFLSSGINFNKILGDLTKYKYSQNNDVLILSHSSDDNTEENNKYPPLFIFRKSNTEFTVNPMPLRALDVLGGGLPDEGLISGGAMVPYLPENNDNIFMYYTSSAIFVINGSGSEVPFFREGHIYKNSSASSLLGSDEGWVQVGSKFRINDGSTEIVVEPRQRSGKVNAEGYYIISDGTVAQTGSLDTSTDEITVTNHRYATGDSIEIVDPEFGTPTATFNDSTQLGDTLFIRRIDADTFTLHPTSSDASSNSNKVDFATATDASFAVKHVLVSGVSVNVVSDSSDVTAFNSTSTGTATDNWQESAWSAYRGFPRVSTFHEQRLYFGGNRQFPDSVWASGVGNLYHFMQTRLVQDSSSSSTDEFDFIFPLSGDATSTDPFDFTIAARQANVIQWMESTRTLLIGTSGSEYSLSGFDQIISNQSINVKKQTDYGSGNLQSISVGNAVLFVTRDGKKLRKFQYNDANGSYIAGDLSILADHMVFKGFDGASATSYNDRQFKEIYYQPSRQTVWLLTNQKELVSLTFNQENEIGAWAYHKTRSSDTLYSFTVVPNSNGDFDELWACFDRDGTSGASRSGVTLEIGGDDFEHALFSNTSSVDSDHPFYVDSAVRITLASSTATAAGFENLSSQTVKVLVNGQSHPDRTVNSSGEITLDATYDSGTEVIAGLAYTAKMVSLDLDAGGNFGSSRGSRKRVDSLFFNVYKSQGGSYGKKDGTLDDFEYDDATPFTGLLKSYPKISVDEEQFIEVQSTDAFPFHIVAMVYRGVTYD